MATFKDKKDYSFNDFNVLKYNKVKIGGKSISGDIVSLIDDEIRKGKYYHNRYSFTREQIERAMDNNDIKTLVKISEHFYRKSGIYSRLCRYMAYLYKYDFFITPHVYDNKVNSKKVIEGWWKSSIFLENSHLKRNFGEIALKVIKRGCYYGLVIKGQTAAYIQELPINYCRSRYRKNGRYVVEFNIKFFDDSYADYNLRMNVLKSFPKEFQKAYFAYKNGTLKRDFAGDDYGWFPLAQSTAVKFNLCDSDAPLFIPVIPALLDLDDAKALNKQKMAQQLLRIIIQKMPIDKNGDLIFNPEEAQIFHNNAVGMVGDSIGVDVLTTFADVEVADLSDNSSVTSVDELERVERTVFNESGTAQNLFNTNGSVALEKSIANDEATMADLLYQFGEFAESLLDDFNKNPNKLKFSVSLLPTTIYNYKDLSKMYKEQTQIGFSKLLPQVALGLPQCDVISTAVFENRIMSLNDLFVPPQMSSTMSSNKATSSSSGNSKSQQTSSNPTGRPELPDDQKSDKTLKNLESEG